MRKIILVLVFSLLNFFGFTQNTEWLIASSKITFKIKNAGFTVDGDVSGLTAKINFDAVKSYSNSIEASVNAKSIATNNGARDKHIHKPDFFDVEKYTTITLGGSTFAKQTDGSFKGYFKLTIKNITKDIVIPFTFIEKEGKANFKGVFTINRLDFGIGESSMILSNTVTVTMDVNVFKK
jgi:polyisoprenoid-binding protein YceI